jgi:hypothetical protein
MSNLLIHSIVLGRSAIQVGQVEVSGKFLQTRGDRTTKSCIKGGVRGLGMILTTLSCQNLGGDEGRAVCIIPHM